ncbi:MAG TPA: RNA polymerase sigma factor [Bacteroidales bacterium]|nr:RNA polymerase sigma factor [Bacteroidales bacterium]HPR12024.1 RNA polymerase sigma factor [Bacteroidales bacterium]HRW86281.1 RNA polymerase sigma factor [Bacteroidales bacterium]
MDKEKNNLETAFLDDLDRHQGILHKISYVYSGNSHEKEDLYQEIILQLWRSYPSFRGGSTFSTWMYRVALNTAITLTRKPRLFVHTEKIPDSSYDIEHSMNRSEDVQVMYKAVAHLDKVEKAIILLWLEDKSYEEIADTVGISVKNVSVRLVRIKAKLAGWIKKYQK